MASAHRGREAGRVLSSEAESVDMTRAGQGGHGLPNSTRLNDMGTE